MTLSNDLENWVENEKKHARRPSGDPSPVEDAISNLSSAESDDVAQAFSRDQETIFAGVKKKIAGELASSQGAEFLASLNLSTQTGRLDEVDEKANDLNDKINTITTILDERSENPPDSDSADQLFDDLKKLQFASPREQETRSNLQGLVDAGLLSEEDLNEFLESSGASAEDRSSYSQKITEVSDRYYTVTTPESDTPTSGDLIIVDPPIDRVLGFEEAELTPDGTLKLKGGDDSIAENKEHDVSVGGTPARRASGTAGSGQLESVKSGFSAVKSDAEFHITACALMRLAGEIRRVVGELREIVNQIRRDLDVLGQLLRNRPIENAIEDIKQKALGEASKLTHEIRNKVQFAIDKRARKIAQNIGVKRKMSGIQSGGNPSRACANKRENACRVKSILDGLSVEVDKLLELGLDNLESKIPYDTAREFVESLRAEYNDFFDKIEDAISDGNRLADKVCSWIDSAKSGTPKFLADFTSVAASILAASSAVRSVLTPTLNAIGASSVLKDVQKQLDRLGLDGAKKKLARGDINGLFDDIGGQDSASGRASESLRERAKKAPTRGRSKRYHQMANVAEARSHQKTTGAKVREGMRARMAQKPQLERARAVRAQAGVLESQRKNHQPTQTQRPSESGPSVGGDSASSPPKPPKARGTSSTTRPSKPADLNKEILDTVPSGATGGTIKGVALVSYNDKRALWEADLSYTPSGGGQSVTVKKLVGHHRESGAIKVGNVGEFKRSKYS